MTRFLCILAFVRALTATTATAQTPPSPRLRDLANEEAARDEAPSIEACIGAALRLARSDPARSQRALRRARRAAWLPQLRLRARRGRERDQNQSDSGTNLSTDDDTVLEATLVFDLSRAVYGPDEVAWSREHRAQRNARLTLVRFVVRLYFERRRLRIEEALGEGDFETALRVAEIEALLDHLTGGLFTERAQP